MSNKRAALYVRVSTDAQTVENQILELRQVAERRGWEVIQVYSDAGILRRQELERTAWTSIHAQGRWPTEVRYRHGMVD